MRPRRRCLVRNAPAPSYGFVVALKFVALERDNRSGKSPSAIGIDRPPTASQPTGSFIGRSRRAPASFSPGATAGLNSIESLMLNRTSWSGLVVWRQALASSAGRFTYNARCGDSLEARPDQHQRNVTLSCERRTGLRKQQGPDSKRMRP